MQVLLGTIIAMICLKKTVDILYEWRRLGMKAVLFRFVVKLPFVRTRVEMEKQKFGAEHWARFLSQR